MFPLSSGVQFVALMIRRLDDKNGEPDDNSGGPDDNSGEPTGGEDGQTTTQESNGDMEASQKVGFIVLAVVLGITIFLLYRCCVWWCRRRGRIALQQESARVEQVLGDIAMVPRDESMYGDEDEEGELI